MSNPSSSQPKLKLALSESEGASANEEKPAAKPQASAKDGENPKAEAEETAKVLDPLAYNVHLPQFEGPLDLLLHLIQSHELDILDIPIAFITGKYLEYLEQMKDMAIDVASEYLVMAAVLTHIKSKMLLPKVPKDQEDDLVEDIDPRAELVQRLLVYQKYKQAARELLDRGTLGGSVFARPPEPTPSRKDAPLASLSANALFEAFSRLLEKRPEDNAHEIVFEKLTINQRMLQLTDRLKDSPSLRFSDLFEGDRTRFDLIVTFLALLEMAKLRMLKVFQAGFGSEIYVESTIQAADEDDAWADTEAAVPMGEIPEAEGQGAEGAEVDPDPAGDG